MAQPRANAQGQSQLRSQAVSAPKPQTDAYGNVVPDKATDPAGYEAWRQRNIAAQGNDTSNAPVVAGNLTAGADEIRVDLNTRQGASTPFSGLNPTGQFAAGTARAPTVAQSVAPYLNSGIGAGGLTSPLMKSPAPAVTSSRPAPAANFQSGGQTIQNPTKVGTAATQATAALGGAPQVDQGLADRRLGEYQEALGMSREVIDRLLNGPSTADKISSRMLEQQLAVARSARGGPGAVQQAMSQAIAQTPQLQAQAAQQAAAEELQRVSAAGNVAGSFAQAALGARGQDVDIAKKNTDAGVAVKGMITQLTGTQLELDQRNQELLGQMARDMAAMDFDWAKLSAEQQNAARDRYLQQYGIDQNIAAQIKLAQQSGKMTMKDWINAGVGVLGAAAGIGAAAAGSPK